MVLMVALDLPGRGVESNRRGSEEIVTRALIAHPWPAIAGPPEGEVSLRVVGAGDPHRPAAGLPLISLGPSLAAGLTGSWHRKGFPQGLAGLGIERGDEPANAELSTRDADHHVAVGDERRQCHVVPGC